MLNSPDGSEQAAGQQETPTPSIKLRLSHPHPLISQTSYKCNPKNNVGHSLMNDYEGIDVSVSRGKFRLALAVMDRLFKAVEQRGLKVRNDGAYRDRGTYAYSGHYDKCQLSIKEDHRRVPHTPTARELAEKAKYKYHSIPSWDFIPTGKLILTPGGEVDLSSQKAFDDVIERAVREVMSVIERVREERQERDKAAKIEYDRQQREAREKARGEAFYKSAEALHRYRIAMDYIEEVRRFGRIPSDQLREGQTLEEWLRWAKAKARAIHPLGY